MRDPYAPFYALGYVRNPFGVLTPAESAELAVLPPVVAAALAQDPRHVQIMGDKGHGKTTTLHLLAASFADEGRRVAYEYIRDHQSRFTSTFEGLDIALVDEVQKLSRDERKRLARDISEHASHLRVVLSSHADQTRLFRRFGVPLTTVTLRDVSLEQLHSVLTRRLDAFALADSPRVTVAPEAVAALWRAYGGDLRSIEVCLYEVFQGLERMEPVAVAHLRACAACAAVSRRR